jgi:signal transduction histidine kinase
MFKKIFLTYLLILVLVMTVLSLTISSLAENYVYGEKKSILENVADRANSAANAYNSGDYGQQELTRILDTMAYITDTKLYIVKPDFYDEIDEGSEFGGEYLKDALKKALAGESVFIRRQYSTHFEARMLFMASPWRSGTEVKGAILLFSPEREVAAVIGGVQLAICLTAAAFVLIGGAIIYMFSRRIVKPIKAIGDASAKMALGEYVEDIDIGTKDELGSMARSFNSMKKKIEANEALRQDLIANISHDLRTPITNINGFLSGMSDGVIKPGEYPRYIKILKKEAKRLMDLTGGILEAAKVRSGSLELNITEFALLGAAKEAAAANAELAKSRNVKIVTDIDSKLRISADHKKITQVLYNLVNNAVKFSHVGGSVRLSAEETSEGVKISVEDNGAGIDENDLPNIFDRFYRASGESGYGLGLSIVKTFVEAHGSHVEIQSGKGEGTLVSFILPHRES